MPVPKDQRERIQNKNTLALAEKTRFEREQRFLEDREGYKFRRDTNVNFLDFFQKFINESKNAPSHLNGSKVALNRFKTFSPRLRSIRHIPPISGLTSSPRR